MLKTTLFCLLSLFAAACNAPEKGKLKASDVVNNPATAETANGTEAQRAPVIAFKEPEFDFGTVKAGEVVKHTFAFTNTGTAPLIIQNVSASCACTVPQWSREPIQPGASGKVQVQFDSEGKNGKQHKTVTVTSNTNPANTEVVLTGNVTTE